MTSVFLAAACWRSLGRLVASGERLYRHTALPSRGVVSLDPWARSWALADLPLMLSCACRELLGGLQKGKRIHVKPDVRAGEVRGVGWRGDRHPTGGRVDVPYLTWAAGAVLELGVRKGWSVPARRAIKQT